MVFLNPTLLLGLLATSIPILLHFLNLRKIKKIEFSTLSFLKELQKTKIRKIKIKQLLLLILRVLIIMFLVLSFARPTLESTTLMGVNSNAKTTAVIIIDNSFSMSVVDGNGSFLNQSKAMAKKIISSFQSDDDIHIFTTSKREEKGSSVSQTIDAIDVSHISLSLNDILVEVSELMSKSNNLNKEVFILSDFQRNIFLKLDSIKEKSNFEENRFYLFQFKNNTINNLSATDLRIDNQIFELNKSITLISEATNFSGTNISNRLNSIFFGNKRVAQKSLSVAGKSTIHHKFETTIDNTGVVEIATILEEDDINYDNVFYNYIMVHKKTKILFVGNNENEFTFVKLAIKSSASSTIDFRYVNINNLNSVNVKSYNTLVVSGASTKSQFVKEVKSYIENGGNVILFPSQNCRLEDENKLLTALNIPKIKTISQTKNKVVINSFNKIDFMHPLFYGIFTKKDKAIESPEVYKYLKQSAKGMGKRVITLQDNSDFLGEYVLGKGKILLFNVSPNLEWSNLPLKNIFSPLINRAISYLASGYTENKSYTAGNVITANISKRKSRQIKVVRPDKGVEIINLTSNQNNYLNYGKTNLIGIYKFYSNNILLDAQTVNYNVAEANIEYGELDKFSKLVDENLNVITKISPSDNYIKIISTTRYGSELWQLFLAIALLLALIEMYIARSSKKDFAEL